MASDSKWIDKAIKKPGALRATAKRLKLLKKGEEDTLSEEDLDKLEERGGITAKRARLARTLSKMRKD